MLQVLKKIFRPSKHVKKKNNHLYIEINEHKKLSIAVVNNDIKLNNAILFYQTNLNTNQYKSIIDDIKVNTGNNVKYGIIYDKRKEYNFYNFLSINGIQEINTDKNINNFIITIDPKDIIPYLLKFLYPKIKLITIINHNNPHTSYITKYSDAVIANKSISKNIKHYNTIEYNAPEEIAPIIHHLRAMYTDAIPQYICVWGDRQIIENKVKEKNYDSDVILFYKPNDNLVNKEISPIEDIINNYLNTLCGAAITIKISLQYATLYKDCDEKENFGRLIKKLIYDGKRITTIKI